MCICVLQRVKCVLKRVLGFFAVKTVKLQKTVIIFLVIWCQIVFICLSSCVLCDLIVFGIKLTPFSNRIQQS